MGTVLLSKDIRKSFGKKEILKGVDLEICKGEVCALLGKNGAGKTTFINTTIGLTFPSGGSVLVYGEKPGVNNKRIGYLSENITLYPHLSATDNLKVAAYSANQSISQSEINRILERINLQDAGRKPTKSFSLGMKRRLQLVMASMVKKVDFLILDEPTNGLDINGMIWLKQYINELKEKDVSILMASHAISELADCITNYVVLDGGVIAKHGIWSKEKENTSGFEIEVPADMLAQLKEMVGENYEDLPDRLDTAIFWKTEKSYKEVCEYLYSRALIPEKITERKSSLEEIYLDTVKEKNN